MKLHKKSSKYTKLFYALLILPLLSIFWLPPFSQSTTERLEALRETRDRLGVAMSELKQSMTIDEALKACQQNPLNSLIANCVEASHTKDQVLLSPVIAPVESSQASNSAITEAQLSEEDQIVIEKIDRFYRDQGMPLEGLGIYFVEAAHKCDMDPYLMPAISVQESSGGKHLFRKKNPFGWGRTPFETFKEAISVVSDNLCGINPRTAGYYKDASTDKKLWHYNGTVNKYYPGKVKSIMEKIRNY